MLILLAGYQGQNIKNPTLPERARKNGGFDFDMNCQFQVDANIGDKLKLPINYNTLANFDFENQLKLDYHGKDDEILKVFQAGNINFTIKRNIDPRCTIFIWYKNTIAIWKIIYYSVYWPISDHNAKLLGLQGGSATQTILPIKRMNTKRTVTS